MGFCLQLLTALPNINCLDSYFLFRISALGSILLEHLKAVQLFLRIIVCMLSFFSRLIAQWIFFKISISPLGKKLM